MLNVDTPTMNSTRRSFGCANGEALFNKKMKTLFKVLDDNNDGILSKQDFMAISQRFTGSSFSVGRANHEFNGLFLKVWEQIFQKDGKVEQITLPYFTDLMQRLSHDDADKLIDAACPLMFSAVDSNHDGHIEADEFRNSFSMISKADTDAHKLFAILDTDKDGKISEAEYSHAFKQFMASEDPSSPYSHLFGHLAD